MYQFGTSLVVEKVKGMCKMHMYYITNAKQELPYYAVDISENQLRAQIISSIMEIGDELEEVTEADFDIVDEEDIVDVEVDTNRVYSLDITKEVDFETQIFNLEQEYNNDQDSIHERTNVVLAPQNDDFDI